MDWHTQIAGHHFVLHHPSLGLDASWQRPNLCQRQAKRPKSGWIESRRLGLAIFSSCHALLLRVLTKRFHRANVSQEGRGSRVVCPHLRRIGSHRFRLSLFKRRYFTSRQSIQVIPNAIQLIGIANAPYYHLTQIH